MSGRRLSSKALMLGAIGSAAVAGALVGALDAPLPGWASAILLVLLLAAAGAVLLAWARMDEAAREAHKWAWYWGGSLGLAAAALVVFGTARADALPWGAWQIGSGPNGLIATGVVLCMACQLAGYVLAWAYWWLSRR